MVVVKVSLKLENAPATGYMPIVWIMSSLTEHKDYLKHYNRRARARGLRSGLEENMNARRKSKAKATFKKQGWALEILGLVAWSDGFRTHAYGPEIYACITFIMDCNTTNTTKSEIMSGASEDYWSHKCLHKGLLVLTNATEVWNYGLNSLLEEKPDQRRKCSTVADRCALSLAHTSNFFPPNGSFTERSYTKHAKSKPAAGLTFPKAPTYNPLRNDPRFWTGCAYYANFDPANKDVEKEHLLHIINPPGINARNEDGVVVVEDVKGMINMPLGIPFGVAIDLDCWVTIACAHNMDSLKRIAPVDSYARIESTMTKLVDTSWGTRDRKAIFEHDLKCNIRSAQPNAAAVHDGSYSLALCVTKEEWALTQFRDCEMNVFALGSMSPGPTGNQANVSSASEGGGLDKFIGQVQ
ncbi:hypothetical protein CYLTODRAFT_481774, partial [Cylindrobasidium torrendii FP15055 ss-10]